MEFLNLIYNQLLNFLKETKILQEQLQQIYFFGEGGSSEHTRRPLWHDDQLHLAEWKAQQTIEYVFNLTLIVNANNVALQKLNAHKKGTHAETTKLSERTNRLRIADDD